MKSAEKYTEIILNDERDKIVTETPTVYTDDKIERLYEFADGAVVKYEWQSITFAGNENKADFNHRFSLVYLPSPNPHGLEKGIIKVISYH